MTILVFYLFAFISIIVLYYTKSTNKVHTLVNSNFNNVKCYKNNITPVFIFIIGLFAYSFIGLYDHVKANENSNIELVWFALVCIIGLISFLVGYGLDDSFLLSTNHAKKLKRETLFRERQIDYIELLLLIGFVIFGIIFRDKLYEMVINFGRGNAYEDYYIRETRNEITGLSSALSTYFTLFILALPFYRSFKYRKIHIFDIFIYVIVFTYALLSGNRTNMIIIILMFAVLLNNRFFHMKFSYIIIGSIISLFLMILIGHLRKYNSFDKMLTMFTEEEVSNLLSIDSSGEFRNTTETCFTYIREILLGNKFFDFGYSYFIEIVMFIPTFIFPDRPLPLQEQYMLDYFPLAKSGTGYGWFIMNDGFITFGLLGVMIEMYIYGKVLKKLYKRFFDNNPNPVVNFLYVYLLLFIFYSVRSSFLLTIKNYLISIAPILIIMIIYKFIKREEIVIKRGTDISNI